MSIIVLVTALVSTMANGLESNSKNNWEFNLAPMYLWAVSINGDQKVKGIDVDLDVPFSEIFDNLNGALTFHFEGVHKQSWGFFTDLNYIVLNPDDGAVDINYTQVLAELAAFYRLIEQGLIVDGFGGLGIVKSAIADESILLNRREGIHIPRWGFSRVCGDRFESRTAGNYHHLNQQVLVFYLRCCRWCP